MSEEGPRLYLITPLVADASGFAAAFETALGVGDIACVLAQVDTSDPHTARRMVQQLALSAQKRGIAMLVGDPQLARGTNVDGVHINGVGPALDEAMAALKPDRIVGAGALTSRDDAMRAGELGVDYLMFGGPWEPTNFADIRDRVAWWAEIFNPPCVGYACELDEVAELARMGADFVALSEAVWDDPRGVAAALEDATRALIGARESAI